MNKGIIILQYRKIIDFQATKQWDKLVFEDSFTEFKLQAQNYTIGTTFTSYASLLANVPDTQRISGLVAPSVTGYVQQLNNIVPDILNNIGRRFLKFNRFQFELINSDIHDQSKHQIGINFYSEPLLWLDTIGDFMLVSAFINNPEESDNEMLTQLFRLQPFLQIYTLKNSR